MGLLSQMRVADVAETAVKTETEILQALQSVAAQEDKILEELKSCRECLQALLELEQAKNKQ